MIRIELTRKLATEHGTTLKLAEDFVNSFLEEVVQALERGERVVFASFGTWEVRHRQKSRLGRNPRTGEAVEIKPASYPVFRAAKSLRQRINATAQVTLEAVKGSSSNETPRPKKTRSQK